MKLIAWSGVIAVVSSLLVIAIFPQFGIQNRGDGYLGAWQGIFAQKNFLGQALTYLAMPAFFLDPGRYGKLWLYAYTAVIAGMVFMSQSSGSIILFGSSLAFIVVIKFLSRMAKRDRLYLAAVVTFLACMGAVAGYALQDVLLPLIGKNATLTGRTLIWGTLVQSLARSPLQGYGYDAFWSSGESSNVALGMHTTSLAYAENGMLEMALGVGLIGLALYVLTYILAVRHALFCFLRKPSKQVMWYMTILFAVAVSNIAAGEIFGFSNLQTFLPLVAYFGLRRERNRIPEDAVRQDAGLLSA
jgi:O-antigen ligase